MINNLFPSVFPTVTPPQTGNDSAQAGQITEKSASVHISGSSESRSLEVQSRRSREAGESEGSRDSHRTRHRDHDHHDHGRSRRSGRSEFFHTAKHMIKDAFKDFRHDIRDSFRDLGFDTGIARKIAKGVIHAAKDALKSGADFSARMMVAAVSQTSSLSAAGSSTSFNMVASSIEVTINHATRTVEVSTANVTIDAQVSNSLAAPEPHLLDIHDSDAGDQGDLTGALLAPQDLENILNEEEAEAAEEPAPVVPAITTTAREAVNNSLASVEETETPKESTARSAVDGVLESAAEDDVAATGETEEAAAAEEGEEAAEENAKPGLDLPEIFTPLLLNRPEYSARIFITAYEHSVNDRHERLTFMRFDAVMPLTTKPADTVEETPAVTPPADIPAVEATEEETESKVA